MVIKWFTSSGGVGLFFFLQMYLLMEIGGIQSRMGSINGTISMFF